MKYVLGLLVLFSGLAVNAEPRSSQYQVLPLEEMRYCGPPKRNAQGSIIRRADVLMQFRQQHPCPVTGAISGSCSGWQMDHVIPLACGGCDSVSNLQWLPTALKTVAKTGKDRFERLIYCSPMQTVTP